VTQQHDPSSPDDLQAGRALAEGSTGRSPDGPTVVALAADHAGIELKQLVAEHLTRRGFAVEDLGPSDHQSVDYPDFAHRVASRIHQGSATHGVLICGTGVGMAISANRWPGVRAVNCTDLYTVKMSRLHNNANLLALGARVVGIGLALELVDAFFDTAFEAGRHTRRVAKIERSD
jgi:ribose 5-phosphate isomerase B